MSRGGDGEKQGGSGGDGAVHGRYLPEPSALYSADRAAPEVVRSIGLILALWRRRSRRPAGPLWRAECSAGRDRREKNRFVLVYAACRRCDGGLSKEDVMKLVLFAAALMLSGAALAQSQPETVPDTATTTTDTTVTTTTTTTGMTVAPGNTAPERDARGIPVISDPAVAPPGTNQAVVVPPGAVVVPNPNQAAAFQTQTAATTYPPCSRTVTDHCVQTYERARRH
jgi:hypothetical protein